MEFCYDLGEHGWANCRVEIKGQRAELVASYVSDALDDLASAVIRVLRGASETAASFHGEPVEFRWQFTRVSPERVRVQIRQLDDAAARSSDGRGKILLNAECRTRAFGNVVLAELERLLAEHGEEGYRKRWIEYDFPQGRLLELRRLLAL